MRPSTATETHPFAAGSYPDRCARCGRTPEAHPYTTRQAFDLLVAEGFAPSDIDDALNARLAGGLELAQPETGDMVLTAAELERCRVEVSEGGRPECSGCGYGKDWCHCDED